MNTLELTYWDVYQEAYGFRPRHVDFTMWNEDTFKSGIELCLAYIAEREAARASKLACEAPRTAYKPRTGAW